MRSKRSKSASNTISPTKHSTIKITLIALLLLNVLALSACSSKASNESEAPSVEPSGSAVVSEAPGGGETSTTSPPASEAPAASNEADQSEKIKQLLESAKEGKVPDIPFAAHNSVIDEVTKAWGKADKEDRVGSGVYATYSSRNTVFGYNKGSQIFDVRSSSPDLQELTLQDFLDALGKPVSVKTNGTDKIYIYTANDQFQLKFILSASTGKVDHISVFSPQDSVNNMAG